MANIFNIQQDLISIFDEIEENDGEITPEVEQQLAIKQEEFKSKIKSYTDVIKILENDIADIKAEKARLNDLQKSKEKTVERLKTIIIKAVETFGDTTKAGGKFVDYGTGKVSVKTTQAIEVEEDSINRTVNRLISCLKWYRNNNQLDSSIVNKDDILGFINSKSPIEEDSNVELDNYSIEDLNNLVASINCDIKFSDIINTTKGINLIKALLDYNIFDIKAKANKKAIKEEAKSETHFMPVYANLVNNKSIIIK